MEMLSSVVLMNQAMDAGDRAALWTQLSSPVTGLSNVEESFAQRLALAARASTSVQQEPDQACGPHRRYMDELMRLKAAAREQGCDYLTWNDIQACVDQVNFTIQEEHERKTQDQDLRRADRVVGV